MLISGTGRNSRARATGSHRNKRSAGRLRGEADGDVDDHVLLAADVAGLADLLQDLVGRDAIALGRALGVQQKAAVDAGVTLDDRGPVGERQPAEGGLE